MKRLALVVSALATVVPLAARAEPVLLISIDGLRPGDVLEADKRGLSIPNLRRFVKEGAHATGVTGVLPTLTYPSHTTLMTGVSPAKHGIVANNSFDPMGMNQGGWYWYAQDVKTPMLWDQGRAVHRQCPLARQRGGQGRDVEPAANMAHRTSG